MPFDINYIIAPVLGALIGFSTNWLAIRMLFRPHEEKRIFGIRLPFTPGIIPARRHELAKKTGETISRHLLPEETLIKSLCANEVKKSIESAIDSLFDNLKNSQATLGEKLKTKATTSMLSDILAKTAAKKELPMDRAIRELLPDTTLLHIKNRLGEKSEDISIRVLEMIKSTFVSEKIKPVIIGLIDRNLRGFAAFFTSPEKVYNSIRDSIIDYFENPDNYRLTSEKLADAYENLIDMNFNGVKDAIAKDLAYFTDAGEAITKYAADKGAEVILSTKLKDIFNEDTAPLFDSLKTEILDNYGDFIAANMPAMIKAVNLSEIIETQINGFEVAFAEEIIISVAGRELRAITYLGGLLGFIIGLVMPLIQFYSP